MKKLLAIVGDTPYRDTHTFETIEAAMVGAVFDFSISILFIDDGVWALLDGQDAQSLGRRTIGKVISALPDYEVSDLYVCADSMRERDLEVSNLVLEAEPVSTEDQQSLIGEQDIVMGPLG